MLAYHLSDILRITPEAVGLTKEASFSEEFPVDSKASALASGLCVAYLTKVAGEHVPYATQEKVAQACVAYGVTEELEKLAKKIERFGEAEKRASLYNAEETRALQEGVLIGALGFDQDLVKVASMASSIVEKFGTQNVGHETLLYSGSMALDSDRLGNALEKRAYLTKDPRYSEILSVVSEVGVDTLNLGSHEKRASVANMVARIDQELHYNGDIFKEAFVKEASYKIRLATKEVPFEAICKLGKDHIGDLIGKDVASAITGDYSSDKAVLESLPLDEKRVLERFL